MNAGDYILGAIEKIARSIIKAREPVILEGEVTEESPLKIKIKDYEITADHCVLDIRCAEQWIRIPKNTKDGYTHIHEIEAETELAKTDGILNPGTGGASWMEAQGHQHKIKIQTKAALPEICLWRGLKKGDKVRVIRLEGGAVHWITGRIEDAISNDSEQDGGKYGDT